jgi:hypothetical protein
MDKDNFTFYFLPLCLNAQHCKLVNWLIGLIHDIREISVVQYMTIFFQQGFFMCGFSCLVIFEFHVQSRTREFKQFIPIGN